MSEENVEQFRKAISAYNGQDVEAMVEAYHPECEWFPFTAKVEGNEAYHGHDGIRRWWANLDATFPEREASVDEIRETGDAVVALGRVRARFRSGLSLDTEAGWFVRFRDGLVVWGRAYQNHAEALKAAGLSE